MGLCRGGGKEVRRLICLCVPLFVRTTVVWAVRGWMQRRALKHMVQLSFLAGNHRLWAHAFAPLALHRRQVVVVGGKILRRWLCGGRRKYGSGRVGCQKRLVGWRRKIRRAGMAARWLLQARCGAFASHHRALPIDERRMRAGRGVGEGLVSLEMIRLDLLDGRVANACAGAVAVEACALAICGGGSRGMYGGWSIMRRWECIGRGRESRR